MYNKMYFFLRTVPVILEAHQVHYKKICNLEDNLDTGYTFASGYKYYIYIMVHYVGRLIVACHLLRLCAIFALKHQYAELISG